MASGTLGDSNEDLNSRGRCRWTENSKVYTRKIHKKTQKTTNNNDTATTRTSITENPSSAAATNCTHLTPARAEVSSDAVATTAAVDVSAAPTSADNNCCSGAPSLPTTNGSLVETTSPHRSDRDHVVQEYPTSAVTRDVTSCQTLQRQEESLSRGSPDRDGDSSHQQLQEEPHQVQLPSLLEDNYSTWNRLQEVSASQTAEPQNLEDSPLPNGNEAQASKSSLPLEAANEPPHTSGEGTQNLRDRSPLSSELDQPNCREVAASLLPLGNETHDGELMPGEPQDPESNGPVNVNHVARPLVISNVNDRIRFNLCKEIPKNEIEDLRKKLECELDQVRSLVKQLESKESQLASYNAQISSSDRSNSSGYPEGADISLYSHPQPHTPINTVDSRVLVKMNLEMSAMGQQETRPPGLARVNSDVGAPRNVEPRPYSRQLSVAVMENNHGVSEFIEKEKRTPKANQYYRNSEFLLGKERLPPENNKRLKTNNGRRHNGETEHAFGFGFDKRSQAYKSCCSLLQRLMKHKFGWVFNEPVDAKALGLFDYHDIIKHPMDLGTIKTRLTQNWYKSPREFAEDVRLVFDNAMTYNPKGQDVHIMAEQLLQIFEERWAVIEAEYNRYLKYRMYHDGRLPTPTSRKAAQSRFLPAGVPGVPTAGFVPSVVHAPTYAPAPAPASIPLYAPAAPQMRTFDRPEPMTKIVAVDPKIQRPHAGRTPVPKKPKAKDPNKRDMTYEEKQRLSTNLQGLPSEKLDAIVQIIKKRNTALSQHDDEIEVDIDSVDAETLWELDRFVTNYKKSLSKNKRKAELALQARMAANQNVVRTNSTPAMAKIQNESGAACGKSTAPAEGEKQSRSSSSSSSSSDSGSSSSDSDSDSSSADGSDAAGRSPRT